ncbi:hypothetical protein [Nocardiopsis sp. NRRL B-16309]|uniref:hypothetical protein n=1 Tax=Nocardiopsis sp. NRRL B-16309 TaxID=1519494 RepID=UPI0006B02215|nr:hypothetical protein [Nocardiopsis sp. NRRL B-16309]KOX10188.1 hypothetical protein ADL05_26305 [Nocardiopsis sp. NRRL B-16309]
MSKYPPDTAVPMPDDITESTPTQVASWYAADCAYQHGIAAHHLTKRSDYKAAAEAFNVSGSSFAIAHLIRALMAHAPDHVAEVVEDMQQTFVQGDAVEMAFEWLHAHGVDANQLREAGERKAKEEGR